MRARGKTVRLLTDYYTAMEVNDPSKYGAYLDENIKLTFANNAPVVGREAVVEVFSSILDRVHSLHHDLRQVWEIENDTVIYESTAVWNLFDGRQLSIEACTVVSIRDSKFVQQHIYVDNSPLFEALGKESA